MKATMQRNAWGAKHCPMFACACNAKGLATGLPKISKVDQLSQRVKFPAFFRTTRSKFTCEC